ncbi:MAG: alpha/beta fold hydrolase [Verrucomicrobiia bacterium]
MRTRLLISFLAIAVLAHPCFGQTTTRTIRLTTSDDVGVVGTFYPVQGDSVPVVLLLPGYNQLRGEWAAFASYLQRNGIAALTIDLRGQGDSTRQLTPEGVRALQREQFGTRDFQNMQLDVEAAVSWLQDQPGIKNDGIAIAGASVGANVALRYAAVNEDLAAILLLSPGINYKGLRTDDVITSVGSRPLRIVVSQYDSFAFESSKRLVEIRKEAGQVADGKELIISTGNLHGTDMLAGVKKLPEILMVWFQQVLLGIAPEPTKPVTPAAESPALIPVPAGTTSSPTSAPAAQQPIPSK